MLRRNRVWKHRTIQTICIQHDMNICLGKIRFINDLVTRSYSVSSLLHITFSFTIEMSFVLNIVFMFIPFYLCSFICSSHSSRSRSIMALPIHLPLRSMRQFVCIPFDYFQIRLLVSQNRRHDRQTQIIFLNNMCSAQDEFETTSFEMQISRLKFDLTETTDGAELSLRIHAMLICELGAMIANIVEVTYVVDHSIHRNGLDCGRCLLQQTNAALCVCAVYYTYNMNSHT